MGCNWVLIDVCTANHAVGPQFLVGFVDSTMIKNNKGEFSCKDNLTSGCCLFVHAHVYIYLYAHTHKLSYSVISSSAKIFGLIPIKPLVSHLKYRNVKIYKKYSKSNLQKMKSKDKYRNNFFYNYLFLLFIWWKILIQTFPSDFQYLVELEQCLKYDNFAEWMSNHEQYLASEF